MSKFVKPFLLIVAFLFAMNIFAQNKSMSDKLSNALKYGQNKQYSEAIKIASESVCVDSLAYGVNHQYIMMDHFYLGVLYKTTSNYISAIEHAVKALEIHKPQIRN